MKKKSAARAGWTGTKRAFIEANWRVMSDQQMADALSISVFNVRMRRIEYGCLYPFYGE